MKETEKTYVLKISDKTKEKMIEYFDDKRRSTTPSDAIFQADERGTVVTLYNNNQVVFKGIGAETEANMWKEFEKNLTNRNNLQPSNEKKEKELIIKEIRNLNPIYEFENDYISKTAKSPKEAILKRLDNNNWHSRYAIEDIQSNSKRIVLQTAVVGILLGTGVFAPYSTPTSAIISMILSLETFFLGYIWSGEQGYFESWGELIDAIKEKYALHIEKKELIKKLKELVKDSELDFDKNGGKKNVK